MKIRLTPFKEIVFRVSLKNQPDVTQRDINAKDSDSVGRRPALETSLLSQRFHGIFFSEAI